MKMTEEVIWSIADTIINLDIPATYTRSKHEGIVSSCQECSYKAILRNTNNMCTNVSSISVTSVNIRQLNRAVLRLTNNPSTIC